MGNFASLDYATVLIVHRILFTVWNDHESIIQRCSMFNERQNTYVNRQLINIDIVSWVQPIQYFGQFRSNTIIIIMHGYWNGIANLSTVIFIFRDWKRTTNNENALSPRIDVSVRQMSITNAHNCLFCVQPAAFLINKLEFTVRECVILVVGWFFSSFTLFHSFLFHPMVIETGFFSSFDFDSNQNSKHATVIGQRISKQQKRQQKS